MELQAPHADSGPGGRCLVVLAGATAVGKSAVAMGLAQALDAEILSADSRQIYRQLEIGVAKPPAADRARVPHHLLDLADIGEEYSLACYQQAAFQALEQVWGRGRLPLLVGGTGLYIRAVTEGFQLPRVAPDEDLRRRLEDQARQNGVASLYQRLLALDPRAARRMDSNNLRRIIRALEVYEKTGLPLSAHWDAQPARPRDFRVLKLALRRSREDLYARIEKRTGSMLEAGLLEECRKLVEKGNQSALERIHVLGYSEFMSFLGGNLTLPEAVARFNSQCRGYARRQMTWFRREPGLVWVEVAPSDQASALARDLQARIGAWLEPEGAAPPDAPGRGNNEGR